MALFIGILIINCDMRLTRVVIAVGRLHSRGIVRDPFDAAAAAAAAAAAGGGGGATWSTFPSTFQSTLNCNCQSHLKSIDNSLMNE